MKKILILALLSLALSLEIIEDETFLLDEEDLPPVQSFEYYDDEHEIKTNGYNRNDAVAYAKKWAHGCNHDCKTGAWSCSPYEYFGSEHCGYKGEGGDCASFVSQCLIAGGHPKMSGHADCRNICGTEPGARRLGVCLRQHFKHRSECGPKLAKPSYIKPGDVLVYHKESCSGKTSHAVLITKVSGSNAYITCHSREQVDRIHTYMASSHPFYEWIHIE